MSKEPSSILASATQSALAVTVTFLHFATGGWLLIGPEVSGHAKAPRPRVQSERVVAPRSIDMSQIITAGNPSVKRYQIGDVWLTLSV
jgi:hypothetical protein